MYLGGGYKFGNYDYSKGRPNPTIGKQSVGRTYSKYLFNPDDVEDTEDDNEDDYDELDDYVNDLSDQDKSGVKSKIITSLPMTHSDPYSFRASDKAAGQLKNTGGANVFEYAGDHKTYAVKGMVPNLSYRSKTNTKGPSMSGQGSALYIRTKPGRFSGTQYGSSRPHKLLTNIEDDNIFNLSDIDAPLYKAFKKQQNKIKKVLSLIKEYLL